MKLYKPKYKDKQGKTKKCQSWYIGFTDNRGTRRRLPAFSNRRASEKAAEKIDELMSCGGILNPDLQRWIENLPEKMRNKLISFGLINGFRVMKHLGKSLTEHIGDFKKSLLAKGDSQGYAVSTTNYVKSVFEGCGFKTWNDIDANRLYTYLADLRKDGIGERTFNRQLQNSKQFCRWMIKERRATAPSPLEHLSCITQTEKRRKRRALTLDEQINLLKAAQNGKSHHNLTGYERYLVYKLALLTGMRANEIRHLTKSSFDFNERTVTVDAGYAKNKKTSVINLKKDLAEELKTYLANKMPYVKVFAMPNQPYKMMKKDLETAEIEYKTAEGQAGFHALRHTFITNLVRQRVYPKDAQLLARHSSITLTLDHYTHVKRESLRKIVDAQPDLTTSKEDKKVG
ncbi:MAG: tyrosine-type recombinase/integrase [Planctomycetota bacterium]|jgi:integrase